MKCLVMLILGAIAASSMGQHEDKQDVFGSSACMGCHGMNAMGGLGPPLAKTKLPEQEYFDLVRTGKGMMPATSVDVLSDVEVKSIYVELQAKDWRPAEIPLSYKVGALLTTRNVGRIFLGVFLLSAIFAVRGIVYWFRLAGLKQMRPALRRFGYGKAVGIAVKSLILDGFFVR